MLIILDVGLLMVYLWYIYGISMVYLWYIYGYIYNFLYL